MKFDAYLSPSRHSIYYFRWPLPLTERKPKRVTLRLSLRTRCPKQAGRLAKQLSVAGEKLRESKILAGLRQDEMREMVRKYFQSILDRHIDQVNARGLPPMHITAIQNGIDLHDDEVSGDTEISDQLLNIDGFRSAAKLTDAQWADNETFLMREMRKADRDHLRAVLAHYKTLDNYEFGKELQAVGKVLDLSSETTLGDAFGDYLAEQERAKTWRGKTAEKNRRALDHLIEIFGPDRVLTSISQRELPSRRCRCGTACSARVQPRLVGVWFSHGSTVAPSSWWFDGLPAFEPPAKFPTDHGAVRPSALVKSMPFTFSVEFLDQRMQMWAEMSWEDR